MSDHKIMLVVGATGSIGRLVVTEALQAGYSVRALVRKQQDAQSFPFSVEVVIGDLTRPDSLKAAVSGIDAIVFTHGTYGGDQDAARAVDYGAVKNTLEVLLNRSVRVSLMSTVSVTDRKGVHDWKRRGERMLRVSGLPYTIVRPGWFDYNKPDQHRIVMRQGDSHQSGTPSDGIIASVQIARVLVRSLGTQAALRKTLELVAESGNEQDNYDPLFSSLEPDTFGGLDGVHDTPNMPLSDEPLFVQEDLKANEVKSGT